MFSIVKNLAALIALSASQIAIADECHLTFEPMETPWGCYVQPGPYKDVDDLDGCQKWAKAQMRSWVRFTGVFSSEYAQVGAVGWRYVHSRGGTCSHEGAVVSRKYSGKCL